jgi:hypothetical protein
MNVYIENDYQSCEVDTITLQADLSRMILNGFPKVIVLLCHAPIGDSPASRGISLMGSYVEQFHNE